VHRYPSGQDIRAGDHVLYADKPGIVELVVTEANGDPALDWYISEFPPNGGFMIISEGLGRVFLTEPDEDLELVTRA
jgi:hypothetical protein